MYWEDQGPGRRPPYLDLCETTIRRHAGRLPVRVVDPASVQSWLGRQRSELWSLSVVHRSDYLRARLLQEHGGIWLDADTIALRPLEPMLELVDDTTTFAGYGEPRTAVGWFVGEARSEILNRWVDGQDRVLDRTPDVTALPWEALGTELLDPLMGRADAKRVPQREVAPIAWRDWEHFLSRTYPLDRVLESDPRVVALYNARLSEPLGDVSARGLIRSRILLARLLRRGLGIDDGGSKLEALAAAGDIHRRLRSSWRFRKRAMTKHTARPAR